MSVLRVVLLAELQCIIERTCTLTLGHILYTHLLYRMEITFSTLFSWNDCPILVTCDIINSPESGRKGLVSIWYPDTGWEPVWTALTCRVWCLTQVLHVFTWNWIVYWVSFRRTKSILKIKIRDFSIKIIT